jgi:hypothetical protein
MATNRGEKTKLFLVDGMDVEQNVPNLLSISGADSSVSEIDTTTLNTGFKTYRPSTICESGTVSFSVIYDPATIHSDLRDLIVDSPANQNWKIEYGDTSYDLFSGFLTKAAVSGGEVDGSEIICDFEIRISADIDNVQPGDGE